MSKASDPPKCRVCGVAHWGTCANHDARGMIADQFVPPPPPTERPAAPDVTASGTPRKRAPKGTFDRKAYQREAARRRRAK